MQDCVDALEKLMDAQGDAVKRVCRAMLRDEALCEDAAQETFVKLYARICKGAMADIENQRAYVLRVAVNVCRDMLRTGWFRHVDRREPLDEKRAGAAVPPDREVHMALDALPPAQRACLVMHYFEGMTLQQIALTMRCSVAGAHRKMKKAEAALRGALSDGEGDTHESA